MTKISQSARDIADSSAFSDTEVDGIQFEELGLFD